jgi:hypothetical protein
VLCYGFRADFEYLKETRTHLRVQTFDRILDFWYAAALSPENFRRWLEPVNRSIRQARLSAAAAKAERRSRRSIATNCAASWLAPGG